MTDKDKTVGGRTREEWLKWSAPEGYAAMYSPSRFAALVDAAFGREGAHSRGLRDGLERAAKIVESRPNIGMDTQLRLLAEAIRAEADKPEPAERKPRVWRDSAGVCHGPATCGCEPSRG